MIFTLPNALYLLSLSVPVVLIYWLIKQEKKLKVSALFLWRETTGKPKKFSLPQKKIDLLLLLQLLILIFLVLSLAGPAVSTESASEGLVLVLDGSASMRKKGAEGSRLYFKAKRSALGLIEKFPNSAVSVYQLSNQPKKLGSGEESRTKIKEKIKESDPTYYSDGSSQKLNGLLEKAKRKGFHRAVILSDKRWEITTPEMELNQLAWGGGANLGIARFSLREKPGKEGKYEIFLELKNYSDKRFEGSLLLSSSRYEKEKEFKIEGRGTRKFIFTSTAETGSVYEAELETNDAFPPDDIRYAVTEKPVARKIGWKGKRNEYLFQAIKASRPLANIYPGVSPDQDLVVYNETLIERNPRGNVLLINSQIEGLIDFTGKIKKTGLSVVSKNDRLIEGVDPSTISPTKAPKIKVNSSIQTVLKAKGTPLLFYLEEEGRKIVSLTPKLEDTDLTSIDFPVLIHNILDWLIPPPSSGFLESWKEPGEKISTAVWGEIDSVQAPEGKNLPLGDGFFLPPGPGIYELKTSSKTYPIPVNVSRTESEIHENGDLNLNLEGKSVRKSRITKRLWPIFAAASLVLLILEALLYYGDFYRWYPW